MVTRFASSSTLLRRRPLISDDRPLEVLVNRDVQRPVEQLRNILLIVGSLAVFTMGASWAMYRASHRSAAWNMVAGAMAVVVGAIVLALLAIYLTNAAFGGL